MSCRRSVQLPFVVLCDLRYGPYKPRTGRTGRCMNQAPVILAALALIYSTHRLLVVWIIVAIFHLHSLVGRYTILELRAVRRPMRVCCGRRWGWCVLFINILDSLTAPCLVYNTAMYTVYGRCGQHGWCMFYTGRCGQCVVYTDPFITVGLKSDGTIGQVVTPRATVPSLSMCDGHTTGHWPVALFKRRDRRRDTFNCPSLSGS